MITETAFFNCDNLPPEMACRFDQPWTFIGEVKTNRLHIECHCSKCARENSKYLWSPATMPVPMCSMQLVSMGGRVFITDDMIEVVVYFGVCEKCDTVHWARSGPPFRRARSCSGVPG